MHQSDADSQAGLAGLSPKTCLIGLDWGTSSLRAYRMGAKGRVLEQREASCGIMQLQSAGDDAFEQAMDATCGDWLDEAPGVALIASGMIGSAQGWRETPYVECPVKVEQLSAALTRISTRRGHDLWLVPGVIQRGSLPELMRGEETQVFGLLAEADDEPLLIGLPGTHSKWVAVESGQLASFHTFMTGEVHAALLGHTILGKTLVANPEPFDAAAFERGLYVARSAEGGGLLSTIFSSRSLVLTGELKGAGQADYLSGLLIGYELLAMAKLYQPDPQQPIALVGSAVLCERYLRALRHCGYQRVSLAPQATAAGLWRVAIEAALIEPGQREGE